MLRTNYEQNTKQITNHVTAKLVCIRHASMYGITTASFATWRALGYKGQLCGGGGVATNVGSNVFIDI